MDWRGGDGWEDEGKGDEAMRRGPKGIGGREAVSRARGDQGCWDDGPA